MSAESVQIIIARAVTDEEFREMLFTNPEEALKEFELTETEHKALTSLPRDHFDSVQQELAERLSKAGFGIGGMGIGRAELSVDGGQSWLVQVMFTKTDLN
jgi:hypothetical protein